MTDGLSSTVCSPPRKTSYTHTHTLPQLPAKARFGHIVPRVAVYSLLSVVKLCDARGDVIFKKIAYTVRMKERVLMIGRKDTKTGLWMLPLAVDKATISQEKSTISQGASAILEHTTSQPTQIVILPINLPPTYHQECMMASIQSVTTEMEGKLTPTLSMEELAKYHHKNLCSPTKIALL